MMTKNRLAWIFALVTASAVACSSDEDGGSANAGGRGGAGGSKAGTGGASGARGGGAAGTGGGVGGSSGTSSAGSSGAGATGGSSTGGSAGVADAGQDMVVPPLVCPDGGAASGFHVSPTGASSGNGSAQSPWDLATALNQPASVQPGATIWLHAGTYRGNFTSRLAGTAANPITVRGAAGERAILDGVPTPSGHVLTINGAHAIYRDFEVTNSYATRVITSTGSNPTDARGEGVGMFGQGVKLVNLVIHDTGQGVGNWSAAPDGEVYGSIIFYNGWDAPDRGHGHGIYAQNQTGKKFLTDNIIFRQFSYGIHGYTEGGFIDNFEVQGNIVFNNGEVSAQSSFATDILVGGLKVAQTPLLRDNATYFPAGEGANNLGYSAGCSNPTLTNNYFVAGTALNLNCTGTISVTGNTFVGSLSGFTQTSYPNNTYSSGRPSGSHVIVRPNKLRRGAGAHRNLQLGKSRLGSGRRFGGSDGRHRLRALRRAGSVRGSRRERNVLERHAVGADDTHDGHDSGRQRPSDGAAHLEGVWRVPAAEIVSVRHELVVRVFAECPVN